MDRRIALALILIGIALLFFLIFSFASRRTEQLSLERRLAICYRFLIARMTTPEGALVRALRLGEKPGEGANSLLSESVGLLMDYAVAAGDREEFEKQYLVVGDLFLAPPGLLYWKIDLPSLKREKCNASLDDLRVAAALLRAHDQWGEERHLGLGRYDLSSRKPAVEYESIAVYALLLRLAAAKRDTSFAAELYDKLISWQNMDNASYWYGAFAAGEAHSFDNLQALLAMAELTKM